MREDKQLSKVGAQWQDKSGEQYIIPEHYGGVGRMLTWVLGTVSSSPGHTTNSLENVGEFSCPLWATESCLSAL